MQVKSFAMVAGSIGRGLEPVQASPTAFSAMVFSFSWNSDSMMPKSFSVLGMPMVSFMERILARRPSTSSAVVSPVTPMVRAMSA